MTTTTRYYFAARNTTAGGDLAPAPACAPAVGAEWSQASIRRVALLAARGAYSGMPLQAANGSNTLAVGGRHTSIQGISGPLAAGVISGTVRAVQQALVTNVNSHMYLSMTVKVVSSDGATVRGVLVASVNSSAEVTEGATTKTIGPVALTPVTAQAGDRLVVEFGVYRAASTILRAVNMSFGDPIAPPADWPFTIGTAGAGVPWVEFALDDPIQPPTALAATATANSLTLTWAPPATGPAPAGYTVSLDGGAPLDVGNVLTHTFTGLAPLTDYTLAVRAYVVGDTSAPATLTTATIAPSLAGLRLEVGPDGDTVDLLGDAYNLTIRRGNTTRGVTDTIEAGTLLAVIRGPSANPQAVAQVRPGHRVRVLAGLDLGDGVEWEPIFTGTLDRARLVYEGGPDKADPNAYRVTLTATDNARPLAAHPADTAVAGTLTQRAAHVLDPTGLPWQAIDTDTPLATPALPTGERTAAGNLRLAVDTLHGLAYVDRNNVITVVADNTRPRRPGIDTAADYVATDDPAAPPSALHYYGLTPTLDTDALVNVLEVERLTTGDPERTVHTDPASAAEWGPHADAVTVNDGVAETHADLWLASRTDPELLPEELRLNVLARPAHVAAAATLEPYTTLSVERAGVLPVPVVMAVRSLEHHITARAAGEPIEWLLTLGLRPLELLATRWDDVPPGLRWDDLDPAMTWDDVARWHPYL